MPKKTTSQWLAPYLEGHSEEEIHGIFIGFKLGLKYAKEEIDDYIKKNDKPAN